MSSRIFFSTLIRKCINIFERFYYVVKEDLEYSQISRQMSYFWSFTRLVLLLLEKCINRAHNPVKFVSVTSLLSVCWMVSWSVGVLVGLCVIFFLKGWKVTLPCSYRHAHLFSSKICRVQKVSLFFRTYICNCLTSSYSLNYNVEINIVRETWQKSLKRRSMLQV